MLHFHYIFNFSSAFGRAKTHKQYDVILILGAGIFTETVTPMLASRLDRALKIYKVQSHNCNILVSGGQGPDEPISEALAMKNYLMKCGVSSSSILMESQSSSTYENFYILNLSLIHRLKMSLIFYV